MTNIPIAAFRYTADNSQALKATDELHAHVKNLSGIDVSKLDFSLTGLTKTLGALAPSLLAGGFAAFTKTAIDWADSIGDAAERAGITAESLSRLQFAAEQSDLEFGSLEVGIKKFQKALSEASQQGDGAKNIFTELGISARTLKQESPENQIALIADAFKKVQDPADRTRISLELFGKAGNEFIPFLLKGSEGIRDLTEAAVALDNRAVAAIDRSKKALDSFWQSVKANTANAAGSILATIFGSGDEILDTKFKIDQLNASKDLLIKNTPVQVRFGIQDALKNMDRQIDVLQKKLDRLNLSQPVVVKAQHIESGPLEEIDITELLANERKRRDAQFRAEMSGDPFREIREDELNEINIELNKAGESNFRISEENFKREFELSQKELDKQFKLQQQHDQQMAAERESLRRYEQDRENAEFQWHYNFRQRGFQAFETLQTAYHGKLKGIATVALAFQKAQAIASIIIDTRTAAMRDLAKAGWVGYALAVADIAFGAAQIAAVASTFIGSGNAPAAGSPGNPVFTQTPLSQIGNDAAAANQSSSLQVIINGNIFSSEESANWFIDTLKDRLENRDVVLFSNASRQAQELQGA